MQIYSDPTRADDPTALPDCEVFYMSAGELSCDVAGDVPDDECEPALPGWYWWPCFPGCLPDGDPVGPFDTEAMAIADAQDWEG